MRRQMVIIVLVIASLLLSTVALAQSGPHKPPLLYTVKAGTASGGHYHLSSMAWEVGGTAYGGGYHLQGLLRPTLRGNGCCCVYVPCVFRNYP